MKRSRTVLSDEEVEDEEAISDEEEILCTDEKDRAEGLASDAVAVLCSWSSNVGKLTGRAFALPPSSPCPAPVVALPPSSPCPRRRPAPVVALHACGDRVLFVFFCVSGLDLLDALDTLDAERRKAIIDWIYAMQVLPSDAVTAAAAAAHGFRGGPSLGARLCDHGTVRFFMGLALDDWHS